MAVFELRQYKIRPDKMSAWLQLMEAEIIPYIVSKGMVVNASFVSTEDDTKYIWVRRFQDKQDLEAKYKDVYESEYWITNIKPRIGDLLIKEEAVINQLEPTSLSPLQ